MNAPAYKKIQCSHCGEDCTVETIRTGDKHFCCQGCKMVYGILNQNGLCDYYFLNERPGNSLKKEVRADKFFFLDDSSIQQKLILFRDEQQTHVSFYLPQIHCSSCLYLLEHLDHLNKHILSATVNFPQKTVKIVFSHKDISLRKVAELLTSVGYEPYISLNDIGNKKPAMPKAAIYQLGVAGFCFANIMLLSFPEYLGLDATERTLQHVFRKINVLLSLPVILYSARPFFIAAWKGLKNKFLNIDLPIAIAILITFGRSLYEVISNTGPGYFDSMTGIVFFMLAGRMAQNKTYRHLSFERDYSSYFPVAVTVIKNEVHKAVALPDIKVNDTLLIHHEELIPADGILTRGKALIDYSFVTGESLPVEKEMGEIVYAGGKQTGGNIELLTIKDVKQSYLTQLWDKENQKPKPVAGRSIADILNKYFTWIVLLLAAGGALYWSFTDTGKCWNVITTVLIVACPCALLLSASFTNGNILRILSRNSFYLKSASAIEAIAAVTHIVFDKTGTLTDAGRIHISYTGKRLPQKYKRYIAALAAQSMHALSKPLRDHLGSGGNFIVKGFREIPGKGIEGFVNSQLIELYLAEGDAAAEKGAGTNIHVKIEGQHWGFFTFGNYYRKAIQELMATLQKDFTISVVSGDSSGEKENLEKILGPGCRLLFNQQPYQKLNYIYELQKEKENVMMIGDGLNDAGALQQSNVGIAVTDDINNFTPASDAILKTSHLTQLPLLIRLCKADRRIIVASFILSILYNITGLFFALQGILSPLVAAILMPASSISILLFTFGGSNMAARFLRL